MRKNVELKIDDVTKKVIADGERSIELTINYNERTVKLDAAGSTEEEYVPKKRTLDLTIEGAAGMLQILWQKILDDRHRTWAINEIDRAAPQLQKNEK